MTKTKTKKEDPIINDEEVSVEKETKKKGEYKLVIQLNDQKFELETDDIKATILSLEPEILKTSIKIQITKGKKTLDRYLVLREGRRLFYNQYTMDSFLKNLLF